MIYYHSGIFEELKPKEKIRKNFFKKYSFLISYFKVAIGTIKAERLPETMEFYKDYFENIMVDSGAYSAFMLKKEISLDRYMDFLHEYGGYFNEYIALDVIGNAKQSLEYYKIMLSEGLKPIPVYHPPFSDLNILEEYIKLGAKYICFGGIASILKSSMASSIVQIQSQLDRSFEVIYKNDKTIKVHGLGIVSRNLLFKYPWHSVDSSKIIHEGKFYYIFFNGETYYIGAGDNNPKYYLNPPTHRAEALLKEINSLKADINFCMTVKGRLCRLLLSAALFDKWISETKQAAIFDHTKIQQILF